MTKKKTTRLLFTLVILVVVALSLSARPVKADSTGTPGQPNQSCQAFFGTGALTPNGFNTAGFAIAVSVYAGSGQNLQTPANSNAVSQYDVACFQASLH